MANWEIRQPRFRAGKLFAKIALIITITSCLMVLAEDSDLAQLQLSAARITNQSLFWGTYRPNLYFGVRTRLPESFMSGLMWFGVDDPDGWRHIRHACDQNDGFEEYSYKKHDGRSFAVQTLKDTKNGVALKTEFLKVPGGEHGGNWGVRISGTPIKEEKPARLSVLYYVGFHGEGSIDLENELSQVGLDDPVVLSGETPELGEFKIKIENGPDIKIPSNIPIEWESHLNLPKLSKTQYWGHLVPDGDIWRAKEYVSGIITQKVESYAKQKHTVPLPYWFTLRNTVKPNSNFYVFQKFVEAPFQFDIYFNSVSSDSHLDAASLTSGLEYKSRSFDERFERIFELEAKGFNDKEISFAEMAMSNLIGGIGYFYGSSIVDRSYTSEVDEDEINFWDKRPKPNPQLTPPAVLFTATPSRPFFPRGFYWDEGFHQLLIGTWDNDLSLDIIKHWTSLIDSDGWVGREQILGEEARSKVPAEFQTQYPHYANPPTLLMAIKAFIDRLGKKEKDYLLHVQDGSEEGMLGDSLLTTTTDSDVIPNRYLFDTRLAKNYIESIYPKIKANYRWVKRTQKGEIKEWGRYATSSKEAYRWRGRTPGHTLTSGLDDYPRPTPPHPAELHTDLMCWVGFMARTLRDIAEFLEEEDDAEDYDYDYRNIVANLQDLHWNEEENAFCDVSVDENDESTFFCHKGYLSLFPMLLSLLPNDSPKLGAILDIIYDPKKLWSPYGLRSLSKSDKFFNTGENYWRGPVWININYLALSSLYKNYAAIPGPYQKKAKTIYRELRDNIIQNAFKEYQKTGYVWEQYSSITGEGVRSHPFTGWTALVTLIMAEKY